MKAFATTKYVRSAAQKARLVADAVRGKMVSEALSTLDLTIQKPVAEDFSKTIKSAVANLQSKNADAAVSVDELKISEIRVDQGPVLKRHKARAQGRVAGILRRRCHITVTVSD